MIANSIRCSKNTKKVYGLKNIATWSNELTLYLLFYIYIRHTKSKKFTNSKIIHEFDKIFGNFKKLMQFLKGFMSLKKSGIYKCSRILKTLLFLKIK